jgi:hypothetical protein
MADANDTPGTYVPYTHPAFRPYALAIGQAALAWNDLHEMLCFLFCSLMGGGPANQHFAIWHILKSDRAQRDVLLAAAKNNYMTLIPENLENDIEWLCKQADKVEEARNNTIHSPLLGVDRGEGNIEISPRMSLGHIRAGKIANKNILAEFRWCRDAAQCLTLFALAMDRTLMDLTQPWPDRPPWPVRRETNAPKRRRRVPQAERPPRLQSSQK